MRNLRLGVLVCLLFFVMVWNVEAASEAEWRALVEKAKQEGKVVLVGPPFRDLRQALTDGFQKALGIGLEYVAIAPGEMVPRVQREQASGRPSMDVLLGGARSAFVLMEAGVKEPIAPKLVLPEVADVSKWRGGQLFWVDRDRQHLLATSSWVFGGILVNTEQVKPEALASWQDLLRPEWKGKIAAHDPRPPGPGQAVAMDLLGRFGEKYIVDLYHGQGVKLTTDARQLAEWVARGTQPIAIGAVQIVIETFRKEKLPIRVLHPKDGPGFLTGGWSVVQLVKGAPHPNAGAAFINWLASKSGQEIYSGAMLERSLRVDVGDEMVPEYTRPQPGIKYVNQYSPEWVAEVWPKAGQRVVELLGR